jgi:hypothetical protein
MPARPSAERREREEEREDDQAEARQRQSGQRSLGMLSGTARLRAA